MNLAGIQLLDIDDVGGFVVATVNRVIAQCAVRLTDSELEDLESDALVAMFDLAAAYTPAHASRHAQWSTFRGYAASMLPKRLIDILRRRGTRTRDPETGKRGWVPRVTVSLDVAIADPTFDERRVATITRFTRPADRSPVKAAA